MTTKTSSTWISRLAWGSLIVAVIFGACRLSPSFNLTRKNPVRKNEFLSNNNWQLAMAAIDKNDFTLAEEFIRQSIGKQGMSPQRNLLQGRMFLASGKLHAANQAFQEAVQSPEWSSRAYFWLGAANYNGGNIAAAEKYWLQAIESDPNNVDAHRSLSMYYYDVGAIDNAVAHLQTTAKLDSGDARPHRFLGLIYSDFERYEEAVDFYRAALKRNLNPQVREEVLRELTSCFLKIREFGLGLQTIETASKTADAVVLKADCLLGLGEEDQANTLLNEVLAKDPKNFAALLSLGDAKLIAGKSEEAVALLQRAVDVRKKDYLANYKLSQALRASNKIEEAKLVEADAETIRVTRERFTQLHKDATSNPYDAEIRFALGTTAEELEMFEMAPVWFKAALQLNPNHAGARQKLGMQQ